MSYAFTMWFSERGVRFCIQLHVVVSMKKILDVITVHFIRLLKCV